MIGCTRVNIGNIKGNARLYTANEKRSGKVRLWQQIRFGSAGISSQKMW